ncbi:MAG: AAA family ATPase [Candidatus Tectomicrobia bacterium]|nr:AAA family ATPase [Candidatus Tectomicrobia bacterium]
MYLEHWGLREFPFSNVPDSRFLYPSASHRESLARLVYLCVHQHGAGVLVGPFGSGKTLLAYALLNSINQEDKFRHAFVQNPRLSPLELLQLIARDLAVATAPKTKSEALTAIESQLHHNILDGRHTLILIDEAHSIESEDTFEEVRLLLNFQLEDAYLLTLLLIGQPGIEAKIDQHKPLAQRISLVTRLQALAPAETDGYIRHRLQVAGRKEKVFQPDAVGAIHRISGGLPRRINHLCDGSLLEGFLAGAAQVDTETVMRAARAQRLTPQTGHTEAPPQPGPPQFGGTAASGLRPPARKLPHEAPPEG